MNNTLKPGRELDALIAEKVMGLEVISAPARYLEIAERGGDFFGRSFVTTVLCHNETFSRQGPGRTISVVPQYSTSINAAWQVVERLKTEGYYIKLHNAESQKKWFAMVIPPQDVMSEFLAEEDTAPHAICLAALAMKGVMDEKQELAIQIQAPDIPWEGWGEWIAQPEMDAFIRGRYATTVHKDGISIRHTHTQFISGPDLQKMMSILRVDRT